MMNKFFYIITTGNPTQPKTDFASIPALSQKALIAKMLQHHAGSYVLHYYACEEKPRPGMYTAVVSARFPDRNNAHSVRMDVSVKTGDNMMLIFGHIIQSLATEVRIPFNASTLMNVVVDTFVFEPVQ